MHVLNIDNLRESFNVNMQILYTLLDKQTQVKEKLDTLKTKYSDMIQNNKRKIFIFCLDSYYFQYKMLVVEMENISKTLCMIKNRIYGDYYKLYNVILSESNLNVDLSHFSTKIKKYLPYKDIEPFFEYNNNDVIQLHNDILQILNLMYREFLQKELKTIGYNDANGLTVDNFIQTLNYDNNTFKGKIFLYVNYLQFYHKLQHNHLNTLLTRITIFVNDINEQIISNNNITFTVENEEYKKNIESYLNSQEPVKEPVKEVVKEPVKEVVKEPVKDVVEEPVKDVVKEVVEKVIKEK
jgi:hypothetical protein